MGALLRHRKRIWDGLNYLSEDKLAEVEDFVSFLKEKYSREKRNIVSLEGLWRGVDFREEEITELRRKTWENLLKKEI
jgi:hypothetical protein